MLLYFVASAAVAAPPQLPKQSAIPPQLPKQSAIQAAAVERAAASAAAHSKPGIQELLSIFKSAVFDSWL